MMISRLLLTLLTAGLVPAAGRAQVFDAPGSPPATPSPAPPAAAPKSAFGQEIPFLSPGSETVTWNGQNWNIGDNRLFRARFEKYLASPPALSAEDQAYRDLMLQATKALAPTNPGGPSLSRAVELIGQAAEHPIDARLCDSLNQAVYSVVLYKKNVRLLADMNRVLSKKRKAEEWNLKVSGNPPATTTTQNGPDGKPLSTVTQQVSEFSGAGNHIKNIVEIDASRMANSARMSAAELKAKAEFQALIVQFFIQRRFEHCILSTRLYRSLFDDGDSSLKLKEGSDVEKSFTSTAGITPTVSALDAMASEAIRDVDEGVQAFNYLAERQDLESASKRLGEAFTAGEYLPRIRTLPQEKKDRVLTFVRQANQLISALDVKDYTLAEELVETLRKTARDFDYSKPRAAIETARSTSALLIQKARSAAIAKDGKTVSESIHEAALIWPTNPDLKSFSTQIASYGDLNSRVLSDLDTLIAQKNYREIFRAQQRYAGAVLGNPGYEEKLKTVLDEVSKIERAVITADELVKAGDTAGAWERLEETALTYPDDNEINRRRAELSSQNPSFIHAIIEARRHEKSGRSGISLSWYLRARQIYPASLLASKGITRLADLILPEKKPLPSTGSRAPSDTGDNIP